MSVHWNKQIKMQQLWRQSAMTKHEAQRSGGTYIGHVSQGRLTTAVLPSSIGRPVLQRGLSRILNKEDGWALGVMYDECNPPQGSKLGVRRRRRGAGQFGYKLAIHRRRACSYGLFPHPRFSTGTIGRIWAHRHGFRCYLIKPPLSCAQYAQLSSIVGP